MSPLGNGSRRSARRACKRAVVQPTLARFDSDLYQQFDLWPIGNDLITSAATIVGQYKLRSADAIHLATALRLSLAVPDSRIAMVSRDRRLVHAGKEAGILMLDPTARDAIAQLREFQAQH